MINVGVGVYVINERIIQGNQAKGFASWLEYIHTYILLIWSIKQHSLPSEHTPMRFVTTIMMIDDDVDDDDDASFYCALGWLKHETIFVRSAVGLHSRVTFRLLRFLGQEKIGGFEKADRRRRKSYSNVDSVDGTLQEGREKELQMR